MTSTVYNKKDWTIGEQIAIPLTGIGTFTATAQKITDKGTLFIFDDYIAQKKMNKKNTNEGGYEASDLKRWINTELFAAFPKELQPDMYGLSIPTVGEFFGHEDDRVKEYFESDEDEQLELMKLRKNRVSYFDNEPEWGWLRNATNSSVSSAYFAAVGTYGYANRTYASYSSGVRPEFWLVRKSEGPCAPTVTEDFRKQISEEAKRAKMLFDDFVLAGFSEAQALKIVIGVILGGH